MQASMRRHAVVGLLAAVVGLMFLLPSLMAQAPSKYSKEPEKESPAEPSGPPPKVKFVLMDRRAHVMPARTDMSHTGGGNIDVAKPRDDTIIITMSGVVTAGLHPYRPSDASMEFDLDQEFAISFADPKIQKAKLTAESQVIGLLRGDKNGGSASVGNGIVVIASHNASILSVSTDAHALGGDDHMAINDHKGPANVTVVPGDLHLHQSFRLNASHVHSICGKAAAAEFAPDGALDPTWISVTDPFRGAVKKDFGFRAILHVEPE